MDDYDLDLLNHHDVKEHQLRGISNTDIVW